MFELLGMVFGNSARVADQVLAKALNGKRKGRSARFQVRLVDNYFHTCALIGDSPRTAQASWMRLTSKVGRKPETTI